ncbi:sodium:alanine symporter family protein [Paludicola sp. MB14-C6]|uniref:alanine/glycine:cation symporter family protein n=1 Tax=Paludihabitans sp. MB14-C6 TaxID=3070656 RepID=UPI0027DAB869|nr:sodium:alanine symporter family protein [Paludicola sp. MB14-C6]WMJ23622.1 sodium:alanine symporter family protein [Paludicola sp. MB14-C6]
MQAFLDSINQVLSGPIMVIGVILVGIILSFKTGFIQATKLGYTLKHTLGSMFQKKKKDQRGITPFQAVTTALSGTIGTGNIVGVATAVSLGGAGAIFWMWVSAFFGMATKYSEIVLAIKYREKGENQTYLGGPMYYLNQAMHSKLLGNIFALLCLASSFGIGNMVQSNAIADSISSVSNINTKPIIIVIAILIGFVIIGGIKRIAKTTEALIPAMALFYLVGCFIIIGMNISSLGDAFLEIIKSAFQLKPAVGGVAGFTMARAIRIGFARGVFTNEAGLGSAPIAHAAADAKSPAEQGLLGIFEVFFDTIIMCTLTGLVIVLSGLHLDGKLDGAALTLGAFEKYLGNFAAIFIAISTVFFAVSSIIGWSYYGETCVNYLFHSKKLVLLYKIAFIIAIYIGAVTSIDFVWGLSDLLNSLMMVPNLIGVLVLSNIVKKETHVFKVNLSIIKLRKSHKECVK